jgi:hypothetical protein
MVSGSVEADGISAMTWQQTCVCGRPHTPEIMRSYVIDGAGGVHYIREGNDIPTADVAGVLDGDLDALLLGRIRRRAEELGEWGR